MNGWERGQIVEDVACLARDFGLGFCGPCNVTECRRMVRGLKEKGAEQSLEMGALSPERLGCHHSFVLVQHQPP